MSISINFRKISESTESQQIAFKPSPNLPTISNQIDINPIFDFNGSSILSAARTLSTYENTAPVSGGYLGINSRPVGLFEYAVQGTTTISSFTASDWFTTTKDTTSSWIIIKGNLTINSGQTFIPSVRKLFTVVYVTGNLTVNGSISMSARGANHSGIGVSGGYTAPVDILIGSGTFSAVVNPQIPAYGGDGAPRRIATTGTASDNGYNSGTNGTNGGSGGGGGGYLYISPIGSYAGSGARGTCFSGGSGSGSCHYGGYTGPAFTSGDAGENGGAASAGLVGGSINSGGAGNPKGDIYGGEGTGGTLIVICEGSLSGSGSIVANGVDTVSRSGITGGASGGGSVNVLFGTNTAGAVSAVANGGTVRAGGNGTARKLAIGAN